jgi:hypothetical protein
MKPPGSDDADMPEDTAAGLDHCTIERIAGEHQVSTAAIAALAAELRRSHGRAAQFRHPDLGGMGQWIAGGMLMIGDMFNHELKAKVDRICNAVAKAVAGSDEPVSREAISWWPEGFGTPSAAGSQNAMRYAFFPAVKRLVVDDNGAVSIYDTGAFLIAGVAQQQDVSQSLSFSTADGPIPVSRFKRVG